MCTMSMTTLEQERIQQVRRNTCCSANHVKVNDFDNCGLPLSWGGSGSPMTLTEEESAALSGHGVVSAQRAG